MNDNPPNNSCNNATNNPTPLDEELVAYLDGELDAEGARRIEALLASDQEVRRRLHSFERTWDLLDELDAAPAGEPFTQTTLEMVAIAARQEAEQDRADAPRRRRRWLLTVSVSFLAAAAAGFLAFAMHDPDRELLRNLPLLENLDEYRQVGSIEFLHKLRDEKLFSKDGVEPPKSETPDDEDVPSRRRRIMDMSLDEKEQLLRSEDRFRSLTPEERQSVRRLHEDLQSDSDRERLRAIMHDYYEWLKPLSPLRWAELAEMKPDQRVASVKKLWQEEQRREGSRRPGRKDMEEVLKWIADCATQHEATLLAALPEAQRKEFPKLIKLRQQTLFWLMWQRWQAAGPNNLPAMMTEEDLSRLRAKLSPVTRKRLEGKPPVEQSQLVVGWMRQGPWHPGEDRRPHGPLPKDEDERIADFFENDLSPEQRDQVLAMPGEEMLWRLQQMYYQTHTKPPEGPGRRTDGPPRHNRRPGEIETLLPWPPGTPPPPPPDR